MTSHTDDTEHATPSVDTESDGPEHLPAQETQACAEVSDNATTPLMSQGVDPEAVYEGYRARTSQGKLIAREIADISEEIWRIREQINTLIRARIPQVLDTWLTAGTPPDGLPRLDPQTQQAAHAEIFGDGPATSKTALNIAARHTGHSARQLHALIKTFHIDPDIAVLRRSRESLVQQRRGLDRDLETVEARLARRGRRGRVSDAEIVE